MAKVTIEIEDNLEHGLDVNVNSTPAFPTNSILMTNAQLIGMQIVKQFEQLQNFMPANEQTKQLQGLIRQ